jgi:hypothetical protein
MRIATIHQLNYLPWIGLFSKISLADCFIILDDAKYTSGSVINRNKIRTKDSFIYLTIPINRNLHSFNINDITLPKNNEWKKNHWLSIYQNYVKAPFFAIYKEFFQNIFQEDISYLWQLNEKILLFLLDVFDIKTKIIKSSDYKVDPDLSGTDLLIELVKTVGADTYLSGQSGKNYLKYDKFKEKSLSLKFFKFIHPVYRQRYPGFEANLSAIDLLFNLGPESSKIIRASGSIESYLSYQDSEIAWPVQTERQLTE